MLGPDMRRRGLAAWIRAPWRRLASTEEVVLRSGLYERSAFGRAVALTDLLLMLSRGEVRMVHSRPLRWEAVR